MEIKNAMLITEKTRKFSTVVEASLVTLLFTLMVYSGMSYKTVIPDLLPKAVGDAIIAVFVLSVINGIFTLYCIFKYNSDVQIIDSGEYSVMTDIITGKTERDTSLGKVLIIEGETYGKVKINTLRYRKLFNYVDIGDEVQYIVKEECDKIIPIAVICTKVSANDDKGDRLIG